MIPTLGRGMLFDAGQRKIHYYMTQPERRRAIYYLSGLAAAVTTLIYIWTHL